MRRISGGRPVPTIEHNFDVILQILLASSRVRATVMGIQLYIHLHKPFGETFFINQPKPARAH